MKMLHICSPLLMILCTFFLDHCYTETNRIIGGEFAALGQFPYQASLQHNGKHFCGGSLISDNFILTAAHCTWTWQQQPEQVKIIMGIIDLASLTNTTNAYNVQEFIIHPKYKGNSFDYDISLIKLTKDVLRNFAVNIIDIINGNNTYAANTMATVSGFGAINRNLELPNKLKYTSIQMWSRTYCNSKYYPQVTTRMICAGSIDGQMGACPGDSGGPLTVDNKLVGIVSWGFGCGTSRVPSVYTYVGIFHDWINDSIELNLNYNIKNNNKDNIEDTDKV